MQAGAFNCRVSLRRNRGGTDAHGGKAPAWVDLATRISAQHLPVSDRERFTDGGKVASVTDRFQVRQAAAWGDLNAKDQLFLHDEVGLGGRLCEIIGVKPIGRRLREGFEITCCALVGNRAT